MTENEKETFERFIGNAEECMTTLTKITDDHEKRLRRLEHYLCLGLGAAGGLKVLYDMIAPLLIK